MQNQSLFELVDSATNQDMEKGEIHLFRKIMNVANLSNEKYTKIVKKNL